MAQAVNNFTLTGNLARVPEIKTTASGKKYAFITIAVNGMNRDNPDFISFVCWEKLAENVTKYCGKGDCISVLGFISTYKADEKSIIQLTADSITFLHKAGKKKEEEPAAPQSDKFEAIGSDPFLPF
jgi:single-strand DNA-binding protein